ncbi:hypothetical protein AB3K25_02840 [Leuconostoc sp. MS02]|uniref:Uncharacterized protein n=1 Tax=Leuconostoc aquikimchii TaxID=3236804 RepID=A0ABV3S479_9LACO
MTNYLTDYHTLKTGYNQEVAAPLKMVDQISNDGQTLVVQNGPIKVFVRVVKENVEQILITSTMQQTPLYDDVFMALEKSLKCASIDFYNAYQHAIQSGSIVSAEYRHVKAIHDASNHKLSVTITKER